MLYNKQEFPKVMQTAGKITILTAFMGVMVFVVAFLFDAGTQQISRVAQAAGTASTTLTVLNTPPAFTTNAYEVTESSTSSPTNSGVIVQWRAIAADSNGAPYFLLICKTNASPTANVGTGIGTVAPACGGGVANRWAVSTGVTSATAATVSTTTIEGFAELNSWYAWVCDDAAVNPRCNNIPVQGYSATNSSPFNVNHRPILTNFYNNGPKNPGTVVSFLSTSTDPDVVGGEDNIYLVVCQTNTYNTTTNTCSSNFLASTSVGVFLNATAAYTLAAIVRDSTYGAFGFIVDQHGHEASANPISQSFSVSNVAPSVLGGDISLNGGSNITLTNPGNETTGFTLAVTVTDANSCQTDIAGSEITAITVAVFRASYGTTTCNGLSASYNPNYCYPSGVPGSVWNLSCTASTTSCTGPTDNSQIFNCTFPLWFVADPTDAGPNTPALFAATNWSAGVRGTDDDGLSSPMATTSSPVELISFTALDLITAQIPYGALEPGADTGTLNATTTVYSVGNTGLDQELQGESMCTTYTVPTECRTSATSTVAESNQKFSTTSRPYGHTLSVTLSSTTIKELELNVAKTTGTTTATRSYGVTYWGIAVPASITLAGSYKGLNTFTAKTAEAANW